MLRRVITTIMFFAIFSVGTIAAETPTAKPTTVRYRATFTSTWSQATHPHPSGNLPGSAHWSRLVGSTHNNTIDFWQVGQLASNGVKNVAEFGYNVPFENEVNEAIGEDSADAYLEGSSLGSAAGDIVMEFDVTSDFDRVTLLTMIAPSPDWFVGVSGEPLRNESGEWLDEVVVDLYPHDAGTDSAPDYQHNNTPTNPAQPIVNAQGSSPFSNAPLGTLTFTRLTNPTAITLNNASVAKPNVALLFIALLLGFVSLQLKHRNVSQAVIPGQAGIDSSTL